MVHKLQDERQREASAERLAELAAVKEELAKLKEQRQQAEVLMQGIIKQRDMYRVIAQSRVRGNAYLCAHMYNTPHTAHTESIQCAVNCMLTTHRAHHPRRGPAPPPI